TALDVVARSHFSRGARRFRNSPPSPLLRANILIEDVPTVSEFVPIKRYAWTIAPSVPRGYYAESLRPGPPPNRLKPLKIPQSENRRGCIAGKSPVNCPIVRSGKAAKTA